MTERLMAAHRCSLSNEAALQGDALCGCFHCVKLFSPREITAWVNDRDGRTARCPYCGVDSVLGESSGYPMTEEFLEEMRACWF